MSEWISVEDRLPEDRGWDPECSVNVLTYCAAGFVDIGFYAHDVEFWCSGVGDELEETITHWQPLPAPPTK